MLQFVGLCSKLCTLAISRSISYLLIFQILVALTFSWPSAPKSVISKRFITRAVVLHFNDHPRVLMATTMVPSNNNNRKANYLHNRYRCIPVWPSVATPLTHWWSSQPEDMGSSK
ncbi:hypothetical protein CTI12_AA175140 [Artemisia annua]|uniref:Uncharacterized protein n=1 Tax=Artemisia annua TaxID=35608 RepID=A0A2U1NTT2_ARTAN|nr:hypothetical protein CTI12_AA175140 [Artemisia annua]